MPTAPPYAHTHYPSDPYAASRHVVRPYLGTSPCRFELVDADGVPVPLPVVVEYNGAAVLVDRVEALHVSAPVKSGRLYFNPRRYGWRIIVVPA